MVRAARLPACRPVARGEPQDCAWTPANQATSSEIDADGTGRLRLGADSVREITQASLSAQMDRDWLIYWLARECRRQDTTEADMIAFLSGWVGALEPDACRAPDPWRPPAYLDAAGKREWRRVVELLRDREGLDELRHEALLRYIAAWTVHQRAAAELPNAASNTVALDTLSQALGRAGRALRAAAADLGIRPPSVNPADPDDYSGPPARPPEDYFPVVRPGQRRH